ncbi:sigma-70 family RNA polymerase sigma factor [Candidatus Poribacteria bacterium]
MKTRSYGQLSPGEEDMSAYPDEQLVLEALDDSYQAFEQLVKQYQHRVLRTVASIVSDEQAVQDLAQETFLSAWRNLSNLKEQQRFGGWLNQIAVNFSRRWLRDQRRYQDHTASFMDMISATQERRHQRDKLRQDIWDAIDGLSTDHREVIILHYISSYSHKEIGQMLSVPSSTVHGRLQQAKRQLRKEFLDMVTQLQLEIDSTVHKFLKEQAKQDGISVEGLILRLIERYKRDTDSPGVAVRKVGEGVKNYGWPSPDGRYLSLTNWETFNLAVRDLATGEIRDVTSDAQKGNRPHRCALNSIWSPDSKQIAYHWDNEGHLELRVVGLDGSEPCILWPKDDNLSKIIPRDWSQDGELILGELNNQDGSSEIVLISVGDGSLQTLRSLEAHTSGMSLSPDGRYVVYGRPAEENNGLHSLFLLAADGSGEEIPLAGHTDGNNYRPLWALDGKTVVFVSNRDPMNATSLWLMQVIDGKQAGAPQFIMRSAGNIWPLGSTCEGFLYYNIFFQGGSDIYFAPVDMGTGELLPQPTRLSSVGFNKCPSWSPDGRKLAYTSSRVSPEDPGSTIRTVLVIRSMETGEEKEIIPERNMHTGQAWIPFGYLRWSPDGRSILCGGFYNVGIHLIDLETESITNIVEFHPRIRIHDLAWSPDGKTFFYNRQHKEKDDWSYSIVAHDLTTGEERELCPGGKSLAISPDGQQLAFNDQATGHIKIIHTAGGEARTLHEGWRVFPGSWTPDGRHLMFIIGAHDIKDKDLWRIPAEGGKAQKLGEMEEMLGEALSGNGSLHPDRQRISYWKNSDVPQQGELWVMENLLTTFAAGS